MKLSIEDRFRARAEDLLEDANEIEQLLAAGGDPWVEKMRVEYQEFIGFARNEARIIYAILNREQYKNYPEFDDIETIRI